MVHRIIIWLMATATSPRAIATKGSPTGAPGQTASTRNPTHTRLSGEKICSKPNVRIGTNIKLAYTPRPISLRFLALANTSTNFAFMPIQNIKETRDNAAMIFTIVKKSMPHVTFIPWFIITDAQAELFPRLMHICRNRPFFHSLHFQGSSLKTCS